MRRTTKSDTLIGRLVAGRYEVVRKIGEGGMGSVYELAHISLNKKFALKVLSPDLVQDLEALIRFKREANIIAGLRHPNIINVIDWEHIDETPCIVMELLHGEALDQRLKRCGALPWETIASLSDELLSALTLAHHAGIVHRDIKPQNVFIAMDQAGGESAKLLDFGISRMLNARTAVTTKARLLGTPSYMSPEQANAQSSMVSPVTDIWAVGTLLYEMAAGQVAFLADSIPAILYRICHEDPAPLQEHRPDAPDKYIELVQQMLHKDPTSRVADIEHVRSELRLSLEPLLNMNQRGRHLSQSQMLGASLTSERPVIATSAQSSKPPAVQTTFSRATGESVLYSIGDHHEEYDISTNSHSRVQSRWFLYVIGSIVILALTLIFFTVTYNHKNSRKETVSTIPKATTPDTDTAKDPMNEDSNRWVRIEPPSAGESVILGVSAATTKEAPKAMGLRPEREVSAPQVAFAIQQHEVTWAELQPWLDKHRDTVVHLPKWLPENSEERANLPATGLPWTTAQAYCASLGARLPTEAEWEFAARGAELRPYAWGKERLDRFRTHAYAHKDSQLVSVMSKDQDRTPGTLESAVYDMMGNAQEWTADLWRNDAPGGDESWVQQGESTYRAVRGLPPHARPPGALPREGAAYRDALCATAACIVGSEQLLASVGVRCARDVRGNQQ